jgi:hypothetical protein
MAKLLGVDVPVRADRSAPAVSSIKKILLFVNKKKQKNFIHWLFRPPSAAKRSAPPITAAPPANE